MEIEKVSELEQKINSLIGKFATIQEENDSLKAKIESMQKEHEELLTFKEEAIAKVDRILSALSEVTV